MGVHIVDCHFCKGQRWKKEQEKNEKEAKQSLGESSEMGGGGQNMSLSHMGRGQAQTFNSK